MLLGPRSQFYHNSEFYSKIRDRCIQSLKAFFIDIIQAIYEEQFK